MDHSNHNDYVLSSVKNALRILNSFSLDEPEKKVTDLAKSLGLGKSTVSRLLSTLASEGFVTKDHETQKYRLGLSILNLNTIVTSNLEVERESLPVLQKLVDDIQETCHIAVLDGTDVIYIKKVECKHPIQILTHIGRRNPAYCTSSGRVLLAYQDEQVVRRILGGELKAYTTKTNTDPETILNLIKKAREQGYTVSVEELREGVTSISAPIRDYTNQVVNTLTVIGPTHRMNPANLKGYIHKIISAANEISVRLGYRKRH
ncbi:MULTISPECIES: IclR family transcriptional regulator [Paenibacillus]|uniref:IclR family transcriptional regulator n=1 Tax=Paenibacillus TaxID=44249 RepID=UPI000889D8EA|nr:MULTISPECIES: IclR family transcriptional regulator [Paenibacillus]NTZ18091.1 IclR family transcriptional regulator [Paenibacillus sp. JMULE4]GCL73042.1 IclR family transcriptional regulator [Paenibacillus naphthalenovorans]SDI69188.1 DNA-binding transcriptional regulator, IclR family [Paenibacillus naphthalenovorans]